MHSAASLRIKGKTLSLPLHAYSKHMGRRKVWLDREFFKNTPYKQKIIFHLAISDEMSQKYFSFCLDGGSVVFSKQETPPSRNDLISCAEMPKMPLGQFMIPLMRARPIICLNFAPVNVTNIDCIVFATIWPKVLLNNERYKRFVFVWREEQLWLVERVCFCF